MYTTLNLVVQHKNLPIIINYRVKIAVFAKLKQISLPVGNHDYQETKHKQGASNRLIPSVKMLISLHGLILR